MKKLMALFIATLLALSCAAMAEAPGFHAEGMPIVDEPVTIRVLTMRWADMGDSFADNPFLVNLEKESNVKIDWQIVSSNDWGDQKPIMLAGGTEVLPDVVLGFQTFNESDIMSNVEYFVPLEDMIEKYMPNLMKAFEEMPALKAISTSADGHIYSLPSRMPKRPIACNVPVINMQWLKNLNLEVPNTIDELEAVLTAFKEQDANGNGDPNDEIPLAGDYKDGWYTNVENPIMNAFCYYTLDLDTGSTTSSDAFGMYMDGDTVCTPFELEAFRDGVKYVRKLVEEDLLYVGSFTQDLAALTQIAESDRLGACSGGYILFCNLGSDIYRNYRRVLPVAGPDGYTNAISYPYGNVGGNGYTISAKCQYPVEAFKLGDLLYSYAATMRGYYGVYGEQWTDADPGAIGINGEPAMYKLLVPWQESEPQSYCVLQMTISYRDAKFRLGEPSDPNIDLYSGAGLETLLYQVTKEYKPYTKDEKAIPSLKFTDEQNETMSVLKANLSATIKEGMISFFNGTKSIDDEYDAWLATLESQGLPQLVEIYQNAYNAQYK